MVKVKILLSILVLAVYCLVYQWFAYGAEQTTVHFAMENLSHPSEVNTQAQKMADNNLQSIYGFVFALCVVFLIWLGDIQKMSKKICLLALLCVVLSSTGCSYLLKPYHEAVLVDINTIETPFLIEVEGAGDQATVQTEAYLNSKMVFSRRIEVPYRWKQTHRYYLWENGESGKWIPSTRLIVVDRSPVTREWKAEQGSVDTAHNQGIWVESKDSIGFSTGITITARISDDKEAVKFLHNYPPRTHREVTPVGEEPFKVDVTRLEEIMDAEIRGRIQAVFAEESAKMNMDELRESKDIIVGKIKTEVIPFFEERGINITNLGQFGGFTYENVKTQEAIDKVFQAQQDQEVAKAEYKAALERKAALKETGEGKANEILEMARGRAEAIKLEADAKAYEVDQLTKNTDSYLKLKQFEVELKKLEKWDGKVPVYMIDGGQTMNTFLPLPPALAK